MPKPEFNEDLYYQLLKEKMDSQGASTPVSKPIKLEAPYEEAPAPAPKAKKATPKQAEHLAKAREKRAQKLAQQKQAQQAQIQKSTNAQYEQKGLGSKPISAPQTITPRAQVIEADSDELERSYALEQEKQRRKQEIMNMERNFYSRAFGR